VATRDTDVAAALPSAAQVEAFLEANPDFLRDRPHLLAAALPDRVLGDNVADFQGAALRALRREVEDLRGGAEELIRNARDNMSIQARTHDAALSFLGADSFEELVRTVTEDLPVTLHLDVALIGVEPGLPKGKAARVNELPEGAVDALLQGADTRLRGQIDSPDALYGAGADLVRSDALVRLPLGPGQPPALLALGSREPLTFQAGQGTELLHFLAGVLAHGIRRWMRP